MRSIKFMAWAVMWTAPLKGNLPHQYVSPRPPAHLHWRVDPRSSLAWWQINPHLDDLWGTTCPEEPSWKPGRGGVGFKALKTGNAAVMDTIIPLFPRPVAQAVCAPAVTGDLFADDSASWTGTRGLIVVRAEALVGGSSMRDTYAQKTVFQSAVYPEIRFRIDSVTGVQRKVDTVSALAIGVFELRGVKEPISLPIRAWPESLGFRVTGKGEFPAIDLLDKYKMSRMSLGLGVTARIWRKVHWGLDAIMVPSSDPGAT